MCPSGGAQHTYFQGSTKTNRTRASYLRSSTENDCVLTQTALSAGWGCGDRSSVVGLDFQVQAAAVSTNPTSFCSDKTLTHPTSLTCSPETWHKRPLDSTLSGEGEKHPEPLVALGPPVLCGGWTADTVTPIEEFQTERVPSPWGQGDRVERKVQPRNR